MAMAVDPEWMVRQEPSVRQTRADDPLWRALRPLAEFLGTGVPNSDNDLMFVTADLGQLTCRRPVLDLSFASTAGPLHALLPQKNCLIAAQGILVPASRKNLPKSTIQTDNLEDGVLARH